MARWRNRLFIATSEIMADAAEYCGLPRDRTVIMGSRDDLVWLLERAPAEVLILRPTSPTASAYPAK